MVRREPGGRVGDRRCARARSDPSPVDLAERAAVYAGRRLSRQPPERGQPSISDAGPDYADERRAVHAALDWAPGRDDSHGAPVVGEGRYGPAPLEPAD